MFQFLEIPFEKYTKDGKVVLIYTCDYGSGWSTNEVYGKFLSGDKHLIEMYFKKAPYDEVAQYLKKMGVTMGYTFDYSVNTEYFNSYYMKKSAWENMRHVELEPGTRYRINSYDGAESVEVLDLSSYSVA